MAFGFDVNNYGDSSEYMYMLDVADIVDEPHHDETLIAKPLPPGTWEIVCTSKGATYMQATTIVEHLRGGFVNYDGNSVPQTGGYDTPFKSLNSLLTSKGCDTNRNWLILKKQ
jgi:hypothetical protein